MKFGFNMLLWTTHVTEEHYPILEALKKTGYDGAEIPVFEGDDAHYVKLRRELDNLGLKVTTVAAEYMRKIIRHSAILGSDVLAGGFYKGLGQFTGEAPTEAELAGVVELHQAIADDAKAAGLKIAIEPLNRFETYVVNTADAAASLVDRIGRPEIGTMFDTFHANIEEKNMVDAFNRNVSRFCHIHISENDRGTPGKGHTNFLPIFKAIRASGYDEWMAIEAFGRALPDLAAATKVWRDFFPSREEVYTEGFRFMQEMWSAAAK